MIDGNRKSVCIVTDIVHFEAVRDGNVHQDGATLAKHARLVPFVASAINVCRQKFSYLPVISPRDHDRSAPIASATVALRS